MILIEKSHILVLGRELPLYILIPIFGMVVAATLNAMLAKRRGVDSSLAFRLTAVVFFAALLLQMANDRFSPLLLMLLYILAVVGIPLVFGWVGRRQSQDPETMTGLGIVLVGVFAASLRLGCFFSGCCHGPAWDGVLSVVYGPLTNCPVKGEALFPLQLVMSLTHLLLLGLTVAGICRKKGSASLWSLQMLNLATYYLHIWISPALVFRRVEAMTVCLMSFFAALCCMAWNSRKRRK